jgi:hypothetical protein
MTMMINNSLVVLKNTIKASRVRCKLMASEKLGFLLKEYDIVWSA